MKKSIFSVLFFAVIILGNSCNLFTSSNSSNSLPICVTVNGEMGDPKNSCQGSGFCSPSGDTSNINNSAPQNGIPIIVCVDSNNLSVISFKFLLSNLKAKQSKQAQYIDTIKQTGKYTFGTSYVFYNPVFEPLHLPKTARIPANQPGKITINGDSVVITMPLVTH